MPDPISGTMLARPVNADARVTRVSRRWNQAGMPAGSNRKSSTDGIVTARLAP